MRIMISGSRGLLGSDCMRVFQSNNEIRSLDRPGCDITNRNAVEAEILDFMPTVVINCAAYTNVDGCETDQENAWAVNAQGPEFLARACNAAGTFLVHISTDYVFDGLKEPPLAYDEEDETAPLSIYGKSKLEGERRIAAHAERYAILRTAWLYGAHGGNFLKTMLRLAVADPERPVKVVNDQFGSPTWSLRLALQVENLVSKGGQGIYHATSEGYCSWFELASCFLKQMEIPHSLVPCTTSEYPTPAIRPCNAILENSRFKRAGLNKMTGWRHGVNQFVSRFRQDLLEEVS